MSCLDATFTLTRSLRLRDGRLEGHSVVFRCRLLGRRSKRSAVAVCHEPFLVRVSFPERFEC